MNLPRLILLSDLFGQTKNRWLPLYLEKLSPYFDIKFYDSCELAGIKNKDNSQEEIHQRFINGGIDRAVNSLLVLEKGKVNILAFSIGGTIAWKANLQGLDVKCFYAISSTRLRKETQIPDSKIKLYFGAQDIYQPKTNWYETKNLQSTILKNEGHDLYRKSVNVDLICKDILETFL